MTLVFVDWTSEAGREVMPGDVVWEAALENLQVIRAEIRPGTNFPIHCHRQAQIIVVLEGALDFSVGEERRIVGRGQVICVAPGVPHGGRVHGPDRVVTLEAFHPPRKDFDHGAQPMDLARPR